MISEYLARTNSDKISRHGYGGFYDRVLRMLSCQGDVPKVLEIGVTKYGVGSGHAFSACPAVGRFVGVDNQPLHTPFPGRGVFIEADAYDVRTVERLRPYGPFGLIIDDGTHEREDIRFFFREYACLCAPGGVMVAEDVHTRYAVRDKDFTELFQQGVDVYMRKNTGVDDSNLLVMWK